MPARDGPEFSWPERLGLVSRRATAFLLEVVPVHLVASAAAGPFVAMAIEHYDPWTRSRGEAIGATTSLIVGAVIDLIWFSLRDAVPGLSWGKRLLGLQVVAARNGKPARLWQRVVRNLDLVLPFFMLVEGVVALLAGPSVRRAGDYLGGTQVVTRDSSHDLRWVDRDGAFLLGAALLFVGSLIGGRYITEAIFNWRYFGELRW
jgi:uncharacterized RDD family membrane protein YckC